jgi:ParB/RepB/Spo0J family partition protein
MTEFRTIPLSDIGESPLNPRSHYDLEELEELSESIHEVGILEPLLVRPRIREDEAREPGRFFAFELVAGHRRARAARMAGLVEAPCLVRELDDAQAIECALVENGQRADVTPMDEAGAFAELARLGRSEAQIAAKIGRSVAYVSQRLRLLSLDASVHDLMEAGRLLMGGALLLAQLPAERQREAAERLSRSQRVLTRNDVSYAVAQTARKVSLAVWALDSTAHGPSCSACPKRSATQRALLAECEGDDLCLDAGCWETKTASWLEEQREAGRTIAEGDEAERIRRWDAPWVLFDDEADLSEDGDDGTWGEVLSGVLPESATVIVVEGQEVRIAARVADVADAIEDDWPEAAEILRQKAARQGAGARAMATAGDRPAAPAESDEDRAAREARNAATDLARKIEEETRLLTIERITEATERTGSPRLVSTLVLACAEVQGAWMLSEMAERRGLEVEDDGPRGHDQALMDAMRDELRRMDDEQAMGALAEMLAIRFVRNAPAGEVPPELTPLLTLLRVKPADIAAEVAARYAPKAEPEPKPKKAAKKVRSVEASS